MRATLDGNAAVASVAHRVSEVVAVGAGEPSPRGDRTIWGGLPELVETTGGTDTIAAILEALRAGALATTVTASRRLLHMLPGLHALVGELTAACLHVAGDQGDVMAVRHTGVALLASGSVQEAHDLAAVGHAASLRARVPFVHFMDGQRTAREVATIDALSDDDLRAVIDGADLAAHRRRALDPERSAVRVAAREPDVAFQAREAQDPVFDAVPERVEEVLARFAARTGRDYHLFDWTGHPAAERAVVVMGSAAGAAEEAVERLVLAGERVGVLRVRLFRPFSARHLLAALPATARGVVVLDRAKEPGAVGEPLFLDVLAALHEGDRDAQVIGARYGLAGKELTPSMVKAALDELLRERPRRRVTLGIVDDVNRAEDGGPRSLAHDPAFDREPQHVSRALFFDVAADLERLGESLGLFAQGYTVHDGDGSVSHLRLGPRRIRSGYLIGEAGLVVCPLSALLGRRDPLARAAPGATVLIDVQGSEPVWGRLPRQAQAQVLEKGLTLWAIDAGAVAPGRRDAVLLACFLTLSGLPRGAEDVDRALKRVVHRDDLTTDAERPTAPADGHTLARRVTAALLAGHGDRLPVSAFPPDGAWPDGVARRGDLPRWEAALCIQCSACARVCPHGAIRVAVTADAGTGAAWRGDGAGGRRYTFEVVPGDCTGCGLCAAVCPGRDATRKALEMGS